jgi:hypothetical protein
VRDVFCGKRPHAKMSTVSRPRIAGDEKRRAR